MSGRQRTLKTAELDRRSWALYIERGRTQREIAAELGVTQGAVSKAIKRVEESLKSDFAQFRLRERTHQLARLDHLYAEAMDAYEKSKAARTARSQRTITGPAGTTQTINQVNIEDAYGDPRFLAQALKALEDKRKLLGLDAPTKMQFVEPERPYADLSDAELERELLSALAALGKAPSVH